MVRTTVLVCVAVLGLAAAPACSGSESPLGPSADDGGAGDATNDAATNPSAYTLDNVCDRTGPKICAIRKSCCEKNGGYDEARCIAYSKTECEKDVAEARAGTMTFDPSIIDGCLAKLTPVIDRCTLTPDDFSFAAEALKDCRVFAGKLGQGLACTRDNQCAPSTTSDAFTSCDKTTKTCKTVRILAAGAVCSYEDGFDGICGKGLYCDIDLKAPAPSKGVCRTALALGAECNNQTKPLECGLGNYCDGTNHCVVGKPGNATCSDNLECAALSCATGDAGAGTCKATNPVIDAAECGK